MRNVPELRFDGFDGEWEVNKISDISNQFDRLRKPVKESLRIKGNYPYYGAAGIQDYVDNYIFDGEYVLIAEDGASDILNYPVNYVNGKFRVNNHAHIIQAKEGYQTLFLSYSLKQIDFNPYLVGGTRKKLNAGSLERIKVKTPSLEEQEKIGKFFKNLDTQIENEEKLLDSYKMMKKSMLQKMFPKKGELVPDFRFDGFDGEWEEKVVGDLLDYEQPTKYIVSSDEYYETGIPVLTANKSFILGYTDEKNIYNKGEVVLFDDFTQDMKYVNFPFMVKSSALKILTEKNSNLFFMFNLLSNINLINEGHKRHYISVVQNTNVVIPSLEEQAKIGQFFKNLDTKIENEEKLLDSYKMMKKSLLQKMFV